MAVLPKVRHELFAKYLAKGMTQGEAYKSAGFTGAITNASALANKPHIKKRVQELMDAEERAKTPVIFIEGEDSPDTIDIGKQLNESIQKGKDIVEGRSPVTSLTEEWVIKQLISNVIQASAANKFSEVNKALAMLGTHLGMNLEGKPGGKGGQGDDPEDKRSSPAAINFDFGDLMRAAQNMGSQESQKVTNEAGSAAKEVN